MRAKIIAGNVLAVLILGLVSYGWAKASIEAELLAEVDGRIARDFELLGRSLRWRIRELGALVVAQAASKGARDVFGAIDESGRRQRAFEVCQRVAAWFGDPARGLGGRPDIVAIVDDRGHVVARDTDVNAMFGVDLSASVPGLAQALAGAADVGVWEFTQDNKMIHVGVAPILDEEGKILGALLVGYDFSNGLAREESRLFDREVAFIWGERVYASSFEGSQTLELQSALNQNLKSAVQTAREQQIPTSPFLVRFKGEEMIGVLGPLPFSEGKAVLGVFASRTAQLLKASSLQLLLLFSLVGILVVLAYGFLIANSLLRPITMVEDDLLTIMNGRFDHRVTVPEGELGGIAYRINQLLNIFTQTVETDERGVVISGPALEQDKALELGGEKTEEDRGLIERLAQEPEDAYYDRLYREYIAAKEAVGENVSHITKDKFIQRVRANEQNLMKKQGCRMVRFRVETQGTQVNLKPVFIP
ncbi:MAG: hypothetical protein NZM37_08100 [Sandaracinaceae bacterium]|nr:hypothetical protein [Sandaracinaceae bacterium]MDW8245498.1 MXAN_5187 C-terminal domain-containing protein [Sandaracinaceae bacterium]